MSRFTTTGNWSNTSSVRPAKFICGYCDTIVKSEKGFYAEQKSTPNGARQAYIYVCPGCDGPNVFDGMQKQTPGALYGSAIQFLPDAVQNVYDEARKALGATAYTASVLAARKLLMNFAVNKGADEGKKFVEYVDYIMDNHFCPPGSKGWVDHIRNMGNEATHEIAPKSKDDAILLLEFLEMILKMNYEFPGRLPKPAKP